MLRETIKAEFKTALIRPCNRWHYQKSLILPVYTTPAIFENLHSLQWQRHFRVYAKIRSTHRRILCYLLYAIKVSFLIFFII